MEGTDQLKGGGVEANPNGRDTRRGTETLRVRLAKVGRSTEASAGVAPGPPFGPEQADRRQIWLKAEPGW